MDTAEKKFLAAAYLDPELLSEQEAKEMLVEMGYDVGAVEIKGKEFISRMHAKDALAKGREEKKEFLTFMRGTLDESEPKQSTVPNYALAARKGEAGIDPESEIKNGALFDALKKRKQEKEKE